MIKMFLAGIGGFIGSVLRYLIRGYIHQAGRGFPYGTLVVNILGCFVIGVLSHLAETRGLFQDDTRVFMFVGILGGFTTFSSFGNETLKLVRESQFMNALANVGANVVPGLAAVLLGYKLAILLWRT